MWNPVSGRTLIRLSTESTVFRNGRYIRIQNLKPISLFSTYAYFCIIATWTGEKNHTEDCGIHSYSSSFKGTGSRDFFALICFHESSSPNPLKITLGSFWIFRKLSEIFASQGALGAPAVQVANLPPVSLILVVDTGSKASKSWSGMVSGRYMMDNLQNCLCLTHHSPMVWRLITEKINFKYLQ